MSSPDSSSMKNVNGANSQRVAPDQLEKWINLFSTYWIHCDDGGENNFTLTKEQGSELVRAFEELQERRKAKHPDEIRLELAMWKKSCSDVNSNLVFQCKSARIHQLEWVLNAEKKVD